MATSGEQLARDVPALADPDFYTRLWGSERRTARALPGAGAHRPPAPLGHVDLRRHAALVALVAAALLLGQLTLGRTSGKESGDPAVDGFGAPGADSDGAEVRATPD